MSDMAIKASDVCAWFRDQQGSTRLDTIVSLLQMLYPLELQFVAVCLDDLVKRDSHCLRDIEQRFNIFDVVAKFNDLNDKRCRASLIVALCLLKSDNHKTATAVYEILMSVIVLCQQTSVYEIFDELMLLLTMAKYHPAFKFDQRMFVASLCDSLSEMGKQVYSLKDTTVACGNNDERQIHFCGVDADDRPDPGLLHFDSDVSTRTQIDDDHPSSTTIHKRSASTQTVIIGSFKNRELDNSSSVLPRSFTFDATEILSSSTTKDDFDANHSGSSIFLAACLQKGQVAESSSTDNAFRKLGSNSRRHLTICNHSNNKSSSLDRSVIRCQKEPHQQSDNDHSEGSTACATQSYLSRSFSDGHVDVVDAVNTANEVINEHDTSIKPVLVPTIEKLAKSQLNTSTTSLHGSVGQDLEQSQEQSVIRPCLNSHEIFQPYQVTSKMSIEPFEAKPEQCSVKSLESSPNSATQLYSSTASCLSTSRFDESASHPSFAANLMTSFNVEQQQASTPTSSTILPVTTMANVLQRYRTPTSNSPQFSLTFYRNPQYPSLPVSMCHMNGHVNGNALGNLGQSVRRHFTNSNHNKSSSLNRNIRFNQNGNNRTYSYNNQNQRVMSNDKRHQFNNNFNSLGHQQQSSTTHNYLSNRQCTYNKEEIFPLKNKIDVQNRFINDKLSDERVDVDVPPPSLSALNRSFSDGHFDVTTNSCITETDLRVCEVTPPIPATQCDSASLTMADKVNVSILNVQQQQQNMMLTPHHIRPLMTSSVVPHQHQRTSNNSCSLFPTNPSSFCPNNVNVNHQPSALTFYKSPVVQMSMSTNGGGTFGNYGTIMRRTNHCNKPSSLNRNNKYNQNSNNKSYPLYSNQTDCIASNDNRQSSSNNNSINSDNSQQQQTNCPFTNQWIYREEDFPPMNNNEIHNQSVDNKPLNSQTAIDVSSATIQQRSVVSSTVHFDEANSLITKVSNSDAHEDPSRSREPTPSQNSREATPFNCVVPSSCDANNRQSPVITAPIRESTSTPPSNRHMLINASDKNISSFGIQQQQQDLIVTSSVPTISPTTIQQQLATPASSFVMGHNVSPQQSSIPYYKQQLPPLQIKLAPISNGPLPQPLMTAAPQSLLGGAFCSVNDVQSQQQPSNFVGGAMSTCNFSGVPAPTGFSLFHAPAPHQHHHYHHYTSTPSRRPVGPQAAQYSGVPFSTPPHVMQPSLGVAQQLRFIVPHPPPPPPSQQHIITGSQPQQPVLVVQQNVSSVQAQQPRVHQPSQPVVRFPTCQCTDNTAGGMNMCQVCMADCTRQQDQ